MSEYLPGYTRSGGAADGGVGVISRDIESLQRRPKKKNES